MMHVDVQTAAPNVSFAVNDIFIGLFDGFHN